MSLTLNMVGGGAGGGLSGSAAVLEVITRVGATVVATSNGVTKTLTPNDAHVESSDSEHAAYIFSISSNQFGSWQVASTEGGITQTKTISISTNDIYVLIINANVPDEYQEVESISANENPWIDSQMIIGTEVDGVRADVQYLKKYSGTTTSTSLRPILGGRFDYAPRTIFDIGHWNAKFAVSPPDTQIQAIDTDRHIIEFGAKYGWAILLDGVTKVSPSASQDVPTGIPVYLFTESKKETASSSIVPVSGKSHSRLYNIKMYKGNTLTSELIPCYRKSDSVAGMYDRVNKRFLTNSGSGTISVGSDV